MALLPVECADCGAHYQVDPAGDIQQGVCDGCGGNKFFYADQPSPTKSDGRVRDLVDMSVGKDRGGNPLGEGTIMSSLQICPICGHPQNECAHGNPAILEPVPGDYQAEGTIMHGDPGSYLDDQFPGNGVRSHVAEKFASDAQANYVIHNANEYDGDYWDASELERLEAEYEQWLYEDPDYAATLVPRIDSMRRDQAARQKQQQAQLPFTVEDFIPPAQRAQYRREYGPINDPTHPDPWMDSEPGTTTFPQNWVHSATERVEAMRPPTLNMEPYPTLWSDEHVAGVGGFLTGLGETALGTLGDFVPGVDLGPSEALQGAGIAQMAGSAGKKLLGMGASHLMKGALGGLMGGQQAGGMAPDQVTPAPNMMQFGSVDHDLLMAVTADLETSDSVKSVDEHHDDPEKQDQKEFNDGDDSPNNLKNPNLDDSGANGEDDTRSDSSAQTGFSEDSPGIERMQMVLPLIMHYFNSDESGQSDPIIKGLHEALEAENPGYLNNHHPQGEQAVQVIMEGMKPKHKAAGVNMMPSGQLPATPTPGSDLPTDHINSLTGNECPICHGALTNDGSCPQCGFRQTPNGTGQGVGINVGEASAPGVTQPFTGKVANGQGPVNPQQIQAMRQALEAMGRSNLVPDMIQNPQDYGWLLNQIQQQPNTAPLVDPEQANQTPPGAMMGAPGGMPVQDPSQPAGGMSQPMQPMAHTEAGIRDWFRDELPADACPSCQGMGVVPGTHMTGVCHQCNGTGKVQPQSQQTTQQLSPYDPRAVDPGYREVAYSKVADANNAVPRCPKCNSATTTIQGEGDNTGDGSTAFARCHSCGNTFDMPLKQSRVIMAEVPNPVMEDESTRHDIHGDAGQDPAHTWADQDGNPLQVGQTYDLYTAGVPTPDVVKVVTKKPDELGLKLVGEVSNVQPDSLDDQTPDFHITPQQMREQRYTFQLADAPQQNSTQDIGPQGGMPGMDQIPQTPPTTDEVASQYPNGGATISAAVVAGDEYDMDDPELCHNCGNDRIYHTASSPTRTMHECDRCGSAWETEDSDYGERTAASDLSWIYNEDSRNDDFFSEMERAQREYGGGSRNISSIAANDRRLQEIHERLEANAATRTAGRHFTPREQKGLINESGHARNADKLDLSGTHYEASSLAQIMGYDPRDPKNRANGENAPSEHLVFGL